MLLGEFLDVFFFFWVVKVKKCWEEEVRAGRLGGQFWGW